MSSNKAIKVFRTRYDLPVRHKSRQIRNKPSNLLTLKYFCLSSTLGQIKDFIGRFVTIRMNDLGSSNDYPIISVNVDTKLKIRPSQFLQN